MSIADMALAAMRAGLNNQRLPDFGSKLTSEALRMVNAIYDEARNWNAGKRVRA